MVTRGSPKPLLRVRVLLPLPNKNDPALVGSFLFSFKGKKDLNGAGVNDVPVARSRRPDRRVSSEEKESFCQKSGIFRAALFSYNQCSPQPGPGNLAFPAACSVGSIPMHLSVRFFASRRAHGSRWAESHLKFRQETLAGGDGLLDAARRGAARHVAQGDAGAHGAGLVDVLLKQLGEGLQLL